MKQMQEVQHQPVLQENEESRLAANSPLRHLYNRRAKNELIKSNLWLIVLIAKKYQHQGLELQELIQEGSIGLMRAAEKFDSEKNCQFLAYAHHWIRYGIIRAIENQSRTIRLPTHIAKKLRKIKKTQWLLSEKLGRIATHIEVASELKLKSVQVKNYLEWGDLFIFFDLSMSSGLPSNEETTLEKELDESRVRENLQNFMRFYLTEREMMVLSCRFGLPNEYTDPINIGETQPLSLSQVGQILDMTRQGVHVIEKKALEKLQGHKKVLKDYLFKGSSEETEPIFRIQKSEKIFERSRSNLWVLEWKYFADCLDKKLGPSSSEWLKRYLLMVGGVEPLTNGLEAIYVTQFFNISVEQYLTLQQYLKSLSPREKKLLYLISNNNKIYEICQELNLKYSKLISEWNKIISAVQEQKKSSRKKKPIR